MADQPTRPQGILALLPFLVTGALSLNIFRELIRRGVDIHVGYYLPSAGGYTRDPCVDLAEADRLIDLTAAQDDTGIATLTDIVRMRKIGLILQVGGFYAYKHLPYVKEQNTEIRAYDILYNKIGHTRNHFFYERCFDGVIVETDDMVHYMEANRSSPSSRIYKVESGIDLSRFAPRAEPGDPAGGFVVGYLGRMSPEKNPLGFVRLAEHLHAMLPALRFKMCGEGDMAAAVRDRIANGPAAAAIEFVGYIEDAADAMAQMDVMVVPSVFDGRPNAIMEANACGLPVIGNPVGGIPELIVDGANGYLIPDTDYPGIADILRELMTVPSVYQRLRASTRAIAEKRFDRVHMYDAYQRVMYEALNG